MKKVCLITGILSLMICSVFALDDGSVPRSSFSREVKGLKGHLDVEQNEDDSLRFVKVQINFQTVSNNNLQEKFFIKIFDKNDQSLALDEQVFLVLSSAHNNNAYYPGYSFMNSGEFLFTPEDSVKIYNFLKNNTEIHMVLQTQSTKRVFLFSI